MISAILGAFVMGSVLFWIITAIFIILAFAAVENENTVWAFVCFLLYVAFFEFLGRGNLLQYSFTHPLNILVYILGYLALGLIWSLVKWWVLFLPEKLEEYKTDRKIWLIRQTDSRQGRVKVPLTRSDITEETPVPEEWLGEWKLHTCFLIPKAKENKDKIVQWFAFWPISFIWSLLSNFIRRLIEKIVDAFRKLYDLAVKQVFSSINAKEYKE